MTYDVLKALHIIFVVTWFAGLFYLFRLFIYHREALDKPAAERDVLVPQFRIMERRLWAAITLPSGVLATGFGTALIVWNPVWLSMPFMWVKLGFVGLLWAYMALGRRILGQCQNGELTASSMRLRFLNEVPTVILIAVIFLIVLRDAVGWIWGVGGILGLALLLTFAIKRYQRARSGRTTGDGT
ncbi:MAG: CopD family protein [Flavobacteriales bacterium]|jgi:putative membrane protein|nr:CopD family protein [Flavobacteriales bacterium]